MGQETTKWQSPGHYANCLKDSTTTTETDNVWATRLGLNQSVWDHDMQINYRVHRRAYLDRRVALGGAQDFSPL